MNYFLTLKQLRISVLTNINTNKCIILVLFYYEVTKCNIAFLITITIISGLMGKGEWDTEKESAWDT